MLPAAITVITVTRGRPALLRRAIASVAAQAVTPAPEQLILVDDCPATAALLREYASPFLTWIPCARERGEQGGSVRLARLRNLALTYVRTPWVAFLDDDNTFTPDHLHTLRVCAEQQGCRAVYSWRVLYHGDGRPYRSPRFPWARAGEDAEQVYAAMVRRRVLMPGSPVMRDRADPLDHPNPIRTIDANEWLLQTDLVRRIRFQETLSTEDEAQKRYDDAKLLLDLLQHDEPLACTHRATVRYFLGGLSNAGPCRTKQVCGIQ
jgi:glycosyltransferase involved in cell wall biosynthesis